MLCKYNTIYGTFQQVSIEKQRIKRFLLFTYKICWNTKIQTKLGIMKYNYQSKIHMVSLKGHGRTQDGSAGAVKAFVLTSDF